MKRKKIIIAIHIILIAICLITTGISAANLVGADSVQYKDTTVKAALDDLMDKVNENACKDGALCSKAKIGDYVRMTPTSTSYTPPESLTGCGGYTIKPNELNLWRVIAVNEDATIDMVSQNVSSGTICFAGRTGYLNFVGVLNTIAKQYENSNYTIGSRHMGYNGQTEYLTAPTNISPAPWRYSTKDNSNESVGGGDLLHSKDLGLVITALDGNLAASNNYWLASRYYGYYSGFQTGHDYMGRCISTDGTITQYDLYYFYLNSERSGAYANAVRPIVTLKSDINEASGSGTNDDPWILG